MKQLWIFFCLLLGLIVYGCDSQPIPVSPIGNISHISSRNLTSQSVLDAGSKALFNASGGLAFANEIFVFTGSQWESANTSLSPDHSKTTNLTALYPAYNSEQDNILITSNPYIENALTDVLIAKSTFTNETEIDLEFKHLFAKLTLHVASSLEDEINNIALIAPKVTSINGIEGSFTVSTNEFHSSSLSKDESGDYSCIIPAIENCNLTIIINPGENEIRHPLTHNFESGYKYECTITQTDTRPGIRTAEDLIDFSKYINGDIAKDQWSRFGYIESNDTIYPLLNCITLTNEENDRLSLIGDHQQTPFSGTFEGNNHTISNLKISAHNGFAGLFGIITHTGHVKRLHFDNCSSETINGSASSGVGLLAGVCYGTITDCSATNSEIVVSNEYPTGGLVGALRKNGNITNCSVQDTPITSKGYAGGISGSIDQSNIINCFVANNTLTGEYIGGISGYANKSYITNCYKYNTTLSNSDKKKKGQIVGRGEGNSAIDYIYYDKGTEYLIGNKLENLSTQDHYKQYNTESFKTTEENQDVYILLNQWINTQTTYSHTFTKWKSKTDLPAVFEE